MSRRSRQKFIRRWHRRLGPVVGIQLFIWSLGGIYFSWVHASLVRSETDMVPQEQVNLKYENFLASIPPLIRNSQLAWVEEIQLGKLLNIPVYRFIQDDRHAEIYNAITGEKLSPIDRSTAVAVAEADFVPDEVVAGVIRVEDGRSEYQGPVPAWKVTFDDWKGSTIFVGAQSGQVTARANTFTRFYNILWMLHLMDYGRQKDVNNWIIRMMSILGIVTISSGYYLWILTVTARPSGKKSAPRRKRS